MGYICRGVGAFVATVSLPSNFRLLPSQLSLEAFTKQDKGLYDAVSHWKYREITPFVEIEHDADMNKHAGMSSHTTKSVCITVRDVPLDHLIITPVIIRTTPQESVQRRPFC
ncbi:Hypothetical protein, putative [Bodo saltans]|uniref:Uncharacterized protein n=1 Tax=Bodo saltans TaxID=75058 RepID=A0A0S4IMD1_BODSA|nr:Hypothetical protein, putative [Bodo saltans]|eukprot:CUE73152.1 Hypothetical protein, putative [Bodo saltans]